MYTAIVAGRCTQLIAGDCFLGQRARGVTSAACDGRSVLTRARDSGA